MSVARCDKGVVFVLTPCQPYDGSEVVLYGYGSAGQKTSVKIGRLALGSCLSGTPWYECSLTTDPLALDMGYDYYANGWLHHVTDGTSNIATFGYDTLGNRTDVDYGNGTHIDYAFSDSDARHVRDSISHMKGATELARIGYTDTARDNAGNPKCMTDWTGTWSYDYDANNRLIHATPPNPVPGQPAGGDYGYDWVGNRLNPPAGETNRMQYNSADQLTRWPGMRRYSYDDAGNLIEVKNDAQTATIAGYTYTPAGLLERADFTGHREGAYEARWIKNAWDADSNRVLMEVGREGSTGDVKEYEHSFVYDTIAGIPAVIEESTPSGVVYYIREPNGSLIARFDADPENTNPWRYYHFDALGSTRLLTDGSGTVTDKYSYDAYGAILAHDGSVGQPYQYVGQLGYYTHWQEPDFGLLQLGVRFYDAEVGRFTSRDPLRDGLSWFSYADDLPVRAVDPLGLFSTVHVNAPRMPWLIPILVGIGNRISEPTAPIRLVARVGAGLAGGASLCAGTVGTLPPGKSCDQVDRDFGLPGFGSYNEARAAMYDMFYGGEGRDMWQIEYTHDKENGDDHYMFADPDGHKGEVTSILCKTCYELQNGAWLEQKRCWFNSPHEKWERKRTFYGPGGSLEIRR